MYLLLILHLVTNSNSCGHTCRSSDKTVKVWDASTRQCCHTFKEHSDQVSNDSYPSHHSTGDINQSVEHCLLPRVHTCCSLVCEYFNNN